MEGCLAVLSETLNCCGCLPASSIPSSKYTLSINDALVTVETGDLVLFSGDAFTSKLMEFICDSSWSHAGLVYRGDDDVPLLLEADFHKTRIPDAITGKPEVGVRVLPLADMLRQYKGNYVAVRKVQSSNAALASIVKSNLKLAVDNFIRNYHLKPYEHRWWEFVLAQYHMFGSTKQTYDSFFCTEIVALCYMNAGILLPNGTKPNQYLPQDFCGSAHLPFVAPDRKAGSVQLSVPMFVKLEEDEVESVGSQYHRTSMGRRMEMSSPSSQYIQMSIESDVRRDYDNRRYRKKRQPGFKQIFCYV